MTPIFSFTDEDEQKATIVTEKSTTRTFLGSIDQKIDVWLLEFDNNRNSTPFSAPPLIVTKFETGLTSCFVHDLKMSATHGFDKQVVDLLKRHPLSRNICSKCKFEFKERILFNSKYTGCMC